MRLPRALLVAVAFACLAPASALAQEEDFSRSGVYLGFGGGAGFDLFEESVEDAVPFPDPGSQTNNTGGINARVGYRILSWLAAEAMWEWMENFSTEFSGNRAANFTTHAITVNAKFLWPKWRFQPYLLAGVGTLYGDWDDKSGCSSCLPVIPGAFKDEKKWAFAGRPGAGFDFYLTEKLLINGEVSAILSTMELSQPFGNINILGYISLGGGIQYRF